MALLVLSVWAPDLRYKALPVAFLFFRVGREGREDIWWGNLQIFRRAAGMGKHEGACQIPKAKNEAKGWHIPAGCGRAGDSMVDSRKDKLGGVGPQERRCESV